MAGVPPAQLSRVLAETLDEYGKLAQNEVHGIAAEVGAEAKARVTAASPKGKCRGSGKYKSGWKAKTEESGSHVRVTVHNRHYQLTHLLENGHRTRLKHGKYGKKDAAGAQPHIAEVNAWAQRELERRIRKALGG